MSFCKHYFANYQHALDYETMVTYLPAGWVWASPTLVCSMLSFVCMVRTSDCKSWPGGQLSWSLLLCTVTATMCTYCPAPFCLHSLSKYVQQWDHTWQMERERMAAETQDERESALHRLCIVLPCWCSLHNVLNSPSNYVLCVHPNVWLKPYCSTTARDHNWETTQPHWPGHGVIATDMLR